MKNVYVAEDAYPEVQRWTYENLDAVLKQTGRLMEHWQSPNDAQEENSVFHHERNCTVYVRYHNGMKRMALIVAGNTRTAKRLFKNLETKITALNEEYTAPPLKR